MYCKNCGKKLEPGQKCDCGYTQSFSTEEVKAQLEGASSVFKTLWKSMKNRMGIGDPLLNESDAFEKGTQIVPNCMLPQEGETNIRQYEVAVMKNKILGITIAKAIAKFQITNKRVLYRALGKTLFNRVVHHQEFDINEISGVESRRSHVFSSGNFLLGLIIACIGSAIGSAFIALFSNSVAATIIFGLLFGTAGCVPFFLICKKWLLKLFCLCISWSALSVCGTFVDSGFISFISFIPLIFALISLVFLSIVPNIVIVIKNKVTKEAIEIKRGRFKSGFDEVVPQNDAERAIREMGALIGDIQKHEKMNTPVNYSTNAGGQQW